MSEKIEKLMAKLKQEMTENFVNFAKNNQINAEDNIQESIEKYLNNLGTAKIPEVKSVERQEDGSYKISLEGTPDCFPYLGID